MNVRRRLAVLAVVAAMAGPAPALADPPGGNSHGPLCQVAAVEDPAAEPGTRSGELSGGPVLLTGGDGTTPESGTLVCRIQVNQSTHGGSGPSVAGHGTGLFTAGPVIVNYNAGSTDGVYLCASFVDDSDGVEYYWDDLNGTWSPDIHAPCSVALGSAEPTAEKMLVDALVCPLLVVAFPPEGDVGDVWDCPPYGGGGWPDPVDNAWELVEDLPQLLVERAKIVIADFGTGPTWAAYGAFTNPMQWWCDGDMAAAEPYVICEHIAPDGPQCWWGGATAAVFPTAFSPPAWGKAQAQLVCEGNLMAEVVWSGVADSGTPLSRADRQLVGQYARRAFCSANDGVVGAPTTDYTVDCTFEFLP